MNLHSFSLKSGKQIQIRSLDASDALTTLEFKKQIPHETTHTLQYVGQNYPTPEEMAQQLERQAVSPHQLHLGAFDGEKLIGNLSLGSPYGNHPWTKHVIQFGMMVLSEYWGNGIAKKLLELQDQFARENGILRIEAHVRVQNERGVKLYERAGFKIEGIRKGAALIDGEYRDEYFIAKQLDDPDLDWKPPTLQTKRLILRPLELKDAASIFEYTQNPKVSEFTLWETHHSIADTKNFIADLAFKNYRNGIPDPLGIAFKENPDQIIGTTGCRWASEKSKSMELGYAIAESQWGKGISAEAGAAVMEYCFKTYDLKRIQAHCKTENTASARVMEKLGMTYEGTARAATFHRGRFWDMQYYAKIV